MFKKCKRKAKRAFCFISLASFLTLTCLIVYILSPYINISLILNIFPFLASTTNSSPLFYGENIDMSQILPGSQHYVVNNKGQDLIDIAANLGINLIRITNAQRSFPNGADSVYTGNQWNQVLNKMQSKGIKALILIEIASNNGDYYTPNIQPIYLDLVQNYIDSGVFSHPDVYAVDIKNEPLLTDANVSMLRAAHTMIKEKYPDMKQTVGWWATNQSPENPNNYNWLDFSAGRKIANIVDFYSIHMYGLDTDHLGIGLQPDLKTKVFVSQVENGLQTSKPILIGEFGEANGDAVSDQDTIGSPALQANIYQGVYQALKEMHSSQLIGSVAFDFYRRTDHSDAWAIVKNNGNYLFPAAYILQEYALGKKNPSLQATTIVNSQSYLFTNADNDSIQTLSTSDRIGLKLQLDANNDSNNYFLSLSTDGVLQPVETFYYDRASDSYYAVYQAEDKGSAQLYITSDSSCTTGITCPDPIYTLTITVQ